MTLRWSLTKSMRLIDALKERVKGAPSARLLKRALEANVCRVNGIVERFASVRLNPGDRIELAANWEKFEGKDPSFSILYEENDLLILNKPVNAICTDEAMRRALKRPVFLAHRLDKDTTGALLLAKNPQVAQELHECFKNRAMEKEYLALVDGVPREKSGIIESYFVKKKTFQGQTIWGSSSTGNGLWAQTSWSLLKSFQDAALLSCHPHTGRTHQIRVHLAEMGHPILIDRQYATRFRSRLFAARPLLHAHRLRFPWKDRIIEAEAPIPDDFIS